MRKSTPSFVVFSLVIISVILIAGFLKAKKSEPVKKVCAKTAVSLQDQFAHVAEASMPAVVVVTARKRVAVIENPYNNMFDFYGGEISYRDVPSGQGSGFFVDPKGFILTNFHIVRGHSSFKAILNDGSEYEAELVGVDPPSDLAMLRIKAKRDFPYLKFANMNKIKIGYWAIAIGAPFSLKQTVTVGIVSHKKRGVGMNLHENFVQTDASINPGNSGGPLLDIHGKVIGVNDFILSPSGGNIGLSFAISADLAKRVTDELIKDGKVVRPWLGVVTRPLADEEKKGLNILHGILITAIYRDSPAFKAGLKPGDIILRVNKMDIDKTHDLRMVILSRHPGENIKIKFYRKGKEKEIDVKVEQPKYDIYKSLNSGRNRNIPAQTCELIVN